MLMLLRENFDQKTVFSDQRLFQRSQLVSHIFLCEHWFSHIEHSLMGLCTMILSLIQAELHLDASLTGMGGFLIINAMYFLFLKIFKITPLSILK